MDGTLQINSEEDILAPQDWSFPVPIAYGPGRLAEIGAKCRAIGVSSPLIVTDRGSRGLPFIDRLTSYLAKAGMPSGIFSEISPNPRDDEISAGRSMFIDGRHDAIIAIGGGKAICLTANNQIDLWDFEYEQPTPEITAAFPTLITIPTTAGIGAETESTAMITLVKKGLKFCIWHPELSPSLALLDPELTIGLPKTRTAWSGADAMTHAIEAYLVPCFHPLCDGLALEGLALVSRWLPIAVSDPSNLAARGGMLVSSCLAGIAFLKGLGMVHAFSHMVGAEYNTQHGLTNAINLPVVLRFNLAGEEAKVIRMSQMMGLTETSNEAFIAAVEKMLDDIGIPKSFEEIGVPADCAQRIAEKAIQDSAAGTNPRPATVAEIRKLIEVAIVKAR